MSTPSDKANVLIGLIVWIVILFFVLWGWSSKPWVNWTWENLPQSIEEFSVLSNAFPVHPLHAVRKALAGMETRSWFQYTSAFEPATRLVAQSPGSPGVFSDIQYRLLKVDDQEALVGVMGIWKPSQLSGFEGNLLYLDTEVRVVRARKDILSSIDLGGARISVGFELGGWYIAYDQQERLPFNFAEGGQAAPLPEVQGTFATTLETGECWLVDGETARRVQVAHAVRDCRFATWAPDGQSAVFWGLDGAGEQGLYLLDLDSMNYLRFLGYGEGSAFPEFSPDSSEIVVVLRSPATNTVEVRIVPADSPWAPAYTAHWPDICGWQWSPDSRAILVHVATEDTNQDGDVDCGDMDDVYVVNTSSGYHITLLGHGVEGIGWSRDSQKIALRTANGVSAIELASDRMFTLTSELTEVGELTWLPDNETVAFHARDPRTRQYDVYKVRYDGGNLTALNLALQSSHVLGWSSDGRRVAIIHRPEEDWEILYLRIADASGLDLFDASIGRVDPFQDWVMSGEWSPDGSKFVFSATSFGDWSEAAERYDATGCSEELYLVDLDTRTMTRLTSDIGLGGDGCPFDGGQWLSDSSFALIRPKTIGTDPEGEVVEPYLWVIDVVKRSWMWHHPAGDQSWINWSGADHSECFASLAR